MTVRSRPLPLSVTSFTTEGSIPITNIGNIFIDTAYSLPFICSAANAKIISLLGNNIEDNYEPIFLQIPLIYSAMDNVVNGNYTETVVKNDNNIITTYLIPYLDEFIQKISTIITYFDITTNILYYQIPSEFSYNSLQVASFAISIVNGNYEGKFMIPCNWYEIVEDINEGMSMIVRINRIPSIRPIKEIASVSVTSSQPCSCPNKGNIKIYYDKTEPKNYFEYNINNLILEYDICKIDNLKSPISNEIASKAICDTLGLNYITTLTCSCSN